MTWIERFEENMKTPAIATPGWYDCIPLAQREDARRLVEAGAPVCVAPAAGGRCTVFFDETEFIAGVFQDQATARQFAAAWNQR